MVSIDERLEGDCLNVRPSMDKFPSNDTRRIEICGAGVRALPFCLNGQLIKILEDLKVDDKVFFHLQAAEISRLRETLKSTRNAALFLDSTNLPKSVCLPWLIEFLAQNGISYINDRFLRSVIELAVLAKLREMKYRARIPVPKAVTLYGIMDETDYLEPHQIFCPVVNDEGLREVLVKDRVLITRSPALHPGDLQIVDAVNVPEDSPLRLLHNCVVFSQRGTRDLPSQLSGGDLDGDLYNVIYDDTLIPRTVMPPADYPRVKAYELKHAVTSDDIIDFFTMFMEQDQLGRIATIHQTIADQEDRGTFHPNCLLLAQLHSTAVDFSKTGIPVCIAFPSLFISLLI